MIRSRKFHALKRFLQYCYQRLTRGWSDYELWSLDHTIATFIVPRLIEFKHKTKSYPNDLSQEQWDEMLDDMIYAFSQHLEIDPFKQYDEDRYDRGMKAFANYFKDLWS